MLSLTDLPPEILLKVLSLLTVRDVARIRQSCTRLRDVAWVKSIWLSFLEGQRQTYPIPPWLDFCSSSDSYLGSSTTEVEHAVVTTHRIAKAWPQTRCPFPIKVQPQMGKMLCLLQMFLDRWLLVVYTEGLAYLLDTVSDPMVQPGRLTTNSRTKICAKLVDTNPKGQARWMFCAAQISEDGQKLIVLLDVSPGLDTCSVYEIALGPEASFKLVATVQLPKKGVIKSISFSDNMLVLRHGSALNLVDIAEKPRRSLLVRSPSSEGLGFALNEIMEVRVFRRYLFAFKSRTIEIHAMDSLLETTHSELFTAIPIAKHSFQKATLRSFKISTPVITSGDRVEIRFQIFAHDSLQGLFNYVIHFQIQHNQPPLLTVELLNIYPLSNHVVLRFTHPVPGLDSHTPPPALISGARGASQQANLSSRGSLTVYAIGPQAKRATWVERVRSDTAREVQVWSRLSKLDDRDIIDGPPREIQRNTVHAFPSGLNDISHCALSESMGLIVLGNQGGDIFLLDVDI